MNIAQPQARSWSPSVVTFSILLHAVVIYGIAVAFQIVPPPVEIENSTPITVTRYTPPPPPPEADPVPQERPRFQQHIPQTPPVAPTVPPSPLPPVAVPQTEGTPVIRIDRPLPEQPIVRTAIKYPPGAEQNQIEGRVVLSITIMPDGSVRDIRVVSARPVNVFENSAVQSVSQWRYRPSNVIRTNVIVEIDYVLT